jgi:pimeloyl-ACP methyl ester carboxylesterase
VVAIEGTNNKPNEQFKRDWSNNFAWGEGAQYREAYDFVKALQEERRGLDRIRVVGHSLGGGIALNLSLRLPRVDAVVFNASPRAFTQVRHHQPGAERIHFSEAGDFLSFFSRPWLRFQFWKDDYVLREYTAYKNNFMDFRFYTLSPVKEHSMYRMSRAILLMAVSNHDAGARKVFEENVSPIDDSTMEDLAKAVKPN